MTGRNGETKQESVSITWSTLPSAETDVKEKVFAYYWSSATREPILKEEAYSYSWSTQPPESAAVEARPEGVASSPSGPAPIAGKARHSGSARGIVQVFAGRIFGGGIPSVRSIGVIGWSAVAGSGAIIALTDASPSVATQLGSIGGLWLGVTAAIWFLPKAIRSRPEGARSAVR